MKQLWIFLVGSAFLLLAGCGTPSTEIPLTDGMLYENPDGAEYSVHYFGEFIVEGIDPEIAFLPTIAEETLVVKKITEMYTEYFLFSAGLWKEYLSANEDTLPGNVVFFDGYIVPDNWVENRYSQVVSVNALNKVRNADKETIDQLLANYASCETDTDCTTYYGACPFGCDQGVNVKFLNIAQQMIENYRKNQSEQCEYGCMEIKGVSCQNSVCVVEVDR